MTKMQEVDDAVAHIKDCTGDPDAWRQALTSTDMAVLVPAAVVDDRALSGLLTKIRANHPTLFDPSTGAPITPAAPLPSVPPLAPGPPAPAGGQEQLGEAATAMKKAEDDLAQQNSSTALLDLHVVTAILNAHATTVESGGELLNLQQDVENSVHARTDLDTPAGARDFQRYLVGKLRQIAAVVETAHLDDTSKTALASAWTALYESSKFAPATATTPQGSGGPPAPDQALSPYGADEGIAAGDPLLDQALGDDLGDGGATWPGMGSETTAAPPVATAAPPPTFPMMSGLPGLGGGAASPASGLGGGLPAALGITPPDEGPGTAGWSQRPADGVTLADLLADEELPEESEKTSAEGHSAEDEGGSDKPELDPPAQAGPTMVHLPNGDTVTAPNPQIANVIKAAVGGTPIVDAFRQQGITVPPPGTAVAHPLDPAGLGSGDVGMFTDRQALALDREQALFNGQIQPVASVSGPSFLGWLHPPGPGTAPPSAASPTTAPDGAGTPQPTRPATSAGRTE